MSYDLYVYRTPRGRDPDEVFEEEMQIEESDDGGEPVGDPILERWFAEIEQLVSAHASSYRCGRHLSINIPYHYEGAEAQQLFSRLASCLQRASTEGGLTVYDPQEGRAIDPNRDLNAMLAGNERGTKFAREISAPSGGSEFKITVAPKKPWWKFW